MGTVNGSATFKGRSSNNGAVSGNSTFRDSSKNLGTVNNDAEFYNGAHNDGVITGAGLFSNNSRNFGVINGAGTFRDQSINFGRIDGDSVFDGNDNNGAGVYDPPLICHWFTSSSSDGTRKRRLICGAYKNSGQLSTTVWGGAWQLCPSTGCFTAPASYRPLAVLNYVLDYDEYPNYERE